MSVFNVKMGHKLILLKRVLTTNIKNQIVLLSGPSLKDRLPFTKNIQIISLGNRPVVNTDRKWHLSGPFMLALIRD